jgi:PAS domain S-box-containing protein
MRSRQPGHPDDLQQRPGSEWRHSSPAGMVIESQKYSQGVAPGPSIASTTPHRLIDRSRRQLLNLESVRILAYTRRCCLGGRMREERLVRQNEALVRLARSERLAGGQWLEILAEVTEAAARALETERTSVWLYDAGRSRLQCANLFELSLQRHSSGAELAANTYPIYFAALQEEHTIAAHEARTDVRTREFCESYLTPLGITSMLDAPIRAGGAIAGVICHEHVGPARRWEVDEQNFAGSVADLLSLALETGERKKAEAGLRRSEEYYRALIENALDVVTLIDAGGIVRYESPSVERVLGYTTEEMIGQRGRTIFHPEDIELADHVLAQFIQNPNKPVSAEIRMRHKNGSWRTMQMIGKNLLDNPAVGGIVVSLRDVTENRNAERLLEEYRYNLENKVLDRTHALNEKNQALEQAVQQLQATQQELVLQSKMASLGSLVAGVAHEVNNPIGAVNSAADVSTRCIDRLLKLVDSSHDLDELKSSQTFRQLVEMIKENHRITLTAGNRIAKIVRSLKNFARLDEAEFQNADLHEGLDSTLTLVHHELRNRAVVVKDYGTLPLVYCSPNQLNQVFMNLFINASQAIDGKGEIRIKTRADGGKVFIQIADTGKGILPQHLLKIFDPGFTTKGTGVGTGLGLSISYNIIQKHKGTITVESDPGKGTEFTITLPVQPESE